MADTFLCPNGHASEWADFCSQCGAAIAAATSGTAPPADAVAEPAEVVATDAAPVDAVPNTPAVVTNTGTCPVCHAPCEVTDLFCEACGADLTDTDVARRSAAPPATAPTTGAAPAGLSLVVSADRDYFDRYVDGGQLVFPDPPPSTVNVPVMKPEMLIGRRSESRGIFPDIDGQALTQDPAVSHKHALLALDATGSWTVTDQGSTNGSRIDDATEILIPGRAYALPPGAALHVGAWTTISVVDDATQEVAP